MQRSLTLFTTHRPNFSSTIAQGPEAEVSYERWQNIYVYDATTLWTAYGVTMFFAALTVLAGIATICEDGAAYDKSFSTILRKSRVMHAVGVTDVDTLVLLRDGGSMPLPKELADLVISTDAPGYPGTESETSKRRSDVGSMENTEQTNSLESVPLVPLERTTM